MLDVPSIFESDKDFLQNIHKKIAKSRKEFRTKICKDSANILKRKVNLSQIKVHPASEHPAISVLDLPESGTQSASLRLGPVQRPFAYCSSGIRSIAASSCRPKESKRAGVSFVPIL